MLTLENFQTPKKKPETENPKVGTEAFWARVDDIAHARLEAAEDNKLHLKAADTLHRELLQELDRWGLSFFSLFLLPLTMCGVRPGLL
jgi:hypothetical protein